MKKSSMCTYIKWQALVSVALAVGARILAAEPTALNVEGKPNDLLSSDRNIRVQAGDLLTRHYVHISKQLAAVLQDAVKTNKLDDRYMSPVHSAIMTVSAWHVYESEETLLSIIDYELDVRSLPLGMNVLGDFFFPAAQTLVQLRVDPTKVANLIARTKDERQRQLLTWVLRSRVSSNEEAGILLKAAGENENVKDALERMKNAANIAALLPAPKMAGHGGKASPTNARPTGN